MPYIREYTELNPKEKRQLYFKRKYKEQNPKWDDSMVLLKNFVNQYITEKNTVLDVGCGHGNFVIDELRNKFSYAVGIDVSREVMKKNICLDTCVVGNISSLPFDNNSFDTVISLWVLEHLDDPKACFQEIGRVLKPGGIFAFVTPNKYSALIWFRRLLRYNTAKKLVEKVYGRTEEDTFDVHYQANSITKVKELSKKYGFDVLFLKENTDPSYTSFGPISYAVSKIFSALPLSFFKPHLVGILKKPYTEE